MTKHLIHWITLCAMLAIGGCGIDDQEQADTPAVEASSGQPAARSSSNAKEEGPGATALTWHLIATENCLDVYGRACTSTFPSPQCAAGTAAGQPCSPSGALCFKTVTSASFREFRCF